MKDGFVRVAAATPEIRVADVEYNTKVVVEMIGQAAKEKVEVLVFPELCLTGYTCSDLFLQSTLLDGAKDALVEIQQACVGTNMLVLVGLPLQVSGRLYNVAAVMDGDSLLGFVPKRYLPTYGEFYEGRHFAPGPVEPVMIDLDLGEGDGEELSYPFGSQLLFVHKKNPQLVVGVEICEDLWVPNPPSIRHAMAGATLICNLSASDEVTGKRGYRRDLVNGQSGRLICGYVYASAGEGESTQDLVFSGHNIIGENGTVLAESKPFSTGMIQADLDLDRLISERRRMGTFALSAGIPEDYGLIYFSAEDSTAQLQREIDKMPFVPSQESTRTQRCEEILSIQAMGLKKRLMHTGCKNVTIGISGGLDSTLALLVTARAFAMLNLDSAGIHAITMPCFGTTDRTYQNAVLLSKSIGATLHEIPIKDAVNQHFKDIGHDPSNHDVTYENGQARERTQVLMDMANKVGGMVIGTGDLSELALGWATYNGDHMSMYGVNCSVPKTLVRHLVRYYADTCGDDALKNILMDVLDTPVSPELLPPEDGQISQKTEDIVGPYELHDFFLYYVLRFGYHPTKIYRMACHAWGDTYDNETILKWLKKFYWRFFSQQFKRSCLPDGPKVGSVAVSPRGDLRMPSDACVSLWQQELEKITVS